MQDALPALVLSSKTLPRNSMSEPTPSHANPAGRETPGDASVSDEQLMLAFPKVLPTPLANSSRGTSNPFSDSSAAAFSNRPMRKN